MDSHRSTRASRRCIGSTRTRASSSSASHAISSAARSRATSQRFVVLRRELRCDVSTVREDRRERPERASAVSPSEGGEEGTARPRRPSPGTSRSSSSAGTGTCCADTALAEHLKRSRKRWRPLSDLERQFGQIDIYLFDQLLRGRIRPGMRVLDAACGGGRNLVYLLQSGFEVFATDADAERDRCRSAAGRRTVRRGCRLKISASSRSSR